MKSNSTGRSAGINNMKENIVKHVMISFVCLLQLMLLIAFSSLILVAKGTMHKANKWQDHWHAQVLLLHINKADSKYELSKEITVFQFNSLKISSKLILHCRMEKQAWEMHWKCQEGWEPRNPPVTLPLHTNVRKLCQQRDWGGMGSDRAPCWVQLSMPCMPEVLHGERFFCDGRCNWWKAFKQKDIPTNLTAATDLIIHTQLGFFLRHQPCKYSGGELSQYFHWCCSACFNVPKEKKKWVWL